MKLTRVLYIGILLLLALTAFLFVVSHVSAASDTGLCYVSSWSGDLLTIRWIGGPEAINYFAVFTIYDQLTGAPITTATEDWVGNQGDTYMWLIYPFATTSWSLTDLTVFADTPTGRQSQDCPGTWYFTMKVIYMPLVMR